MRREDEMDIVERLRTVDICDYELITDTLVDAADEIERLRNELAQRPRIDENMLKGATDTAAMIVNELREQLAACQKDAEYWRNKYESRE